MWMVLLHVTPLTVAAVLVSLLLSALILARWRGRSPDTARRALRGLLAAATVVYLAILAMPVFSWELVGTGQSRHVDWNPLSAYEELRWQQEQEEHVEPEEFSVLLEHGDALAHYTARELTPEQVEEARDGRVGLGEQAGGREIDYVVHPTTGGREVVLTPEGGEVSPETAARVLAEVRPVIDAQGQPVRFQTLIVEEKLVNALLFVPVGVVACLALGSWPSRLLYGPALSLTIETVQWAMAAGRGAGTGDLLVNTVGSVAGVAMAAAAVALVRRTLLDRSSRARSPA
ncbi:hypothetical protein A6A08_02735 [Nocardiopsis sp. TSRI0078]|uniref:VanZ family protein n=1 Tax=unclassified Nocardiopsis TaxID=2649073 RepID=UPI00093D6231|nr:VanZ family protein [Nocardiopsis sp. TSRI0078]OKI23698.1 hypothetical protein A6A08_02735 [Nocardiopsis sp. TSRI0078]